MDNNLDNNTPRPGGESLNERLRRAAEMARRNIAAEDVAPRGTAPVPPQAPVSPRPASAPTPAMPGATGYPTPRPTTVQHPGTVAPQPAVPPRPQAPAPPVQRPWNGTSRYPRTTPGPRA